LQPYVTGKRVEAQESSLGSQRCGEKEHEEGEEEEKEGPEARQLQLDGGSAGSQSCHVRARDLCQVGPLRMQDVRQRGVASAYQRRGN
jgi:hypothetical protein